MRNRMLCLALTLCLLLTACGGSEEDAPRLLYRRKAQKWKRKRCF